jgi:hypothetical protein
MLALSSALIGRASSCQALPSPFWSTLRSAIASMMGNRAHLIDETAGKRRGADFSW